MGEIVMERWLVPVTGVEKEGVVSEGRLLHPMTRPCNRIEILRRVPFALHSAPGWFSLYCLISVLRILSRFTYLHESLLVVHRVGLLLPDHRPLLLLPIFLQMY